MMGTPRRGRRATSPLERAVGRERRQVRDRSGFHCATCAPIGPVAWPSAGKPRPARRRPPRPARLHRIFLVQQRPDDPQSGLIAKSLSMPTAASISCPVPNSSICVATHLVYPFCVAVCGPATPQQGRPGIVVRTGHCPNEVRCGELGVDDIVRDLDQAPVVASCIGTQVREGHLDVDAGRRSASTPLACSIRTRLCRACWSSSLTTFAGSRAPFCKMAMVATSAKAWASARPSDSLSMPASAPKRFNAPIVVPRRRMGSACTEQNPTARLSRAKCGHRPSPIVRSHCHHRPARAEAVERRAFLTLKLVKPKNAMASFDDAITPSSPSGETNKIARGGDRVPRRIDQSRWSRAR